MELQAALPKTKIIHKEQLRPSPSSAGPLPQPGDWTEHVNAAQTEAELTALRAPVVSGAPYGDENRRHGP